MQSLRERQRALQQKKKWKNVAIWCKRDRKLLVPESPSIHSSDCLQETATKKHKIVSLIAHLDFRSQSLLEWCNLLVYTTCLNKTFYNLNTPWSLIWNLMPADSIPCVIQPLGLSVISILYFFVCELPVLGSFSCHLNKTST